MDVNLLSPTSEKASGLGGTSLYSILYKLCGGSRADWLIRWWRWWNSWGNRWRLSCRGWASFRRISLSHRNLFARGNWKLTFSGCRSPKERGLCCSVDWGVDSGRKKVGGRCSGWGKVGLGLSEIRLTGADLLWRLEECRLCHSEEEDYYQKVCICWSFHYIYIWSLLKWWGKNNIWIQMIKITFVVSDSVLLHSHMPWELSHSNNHIQEHELWYCI